MNNEPSEKIVIRPEELTMPGMHQGEPLKRPATPRPPSVSSGSCSLPIPPLVAPHAALSRPLLVIVLCAIGVTIFVAAVFFVIAPRNPVVDEQAIKLRTTIANIERVLHEDAKTTNGANTVAQVVGRMQAIDTSGCPNDFRSAYLAHVHAWETLAKVEQDYAAFKRQNGGIDALLEAFLRGLLGDPFGKANEVLADQNDLQRRARAAHEELRLTYNRAKEVAVGHGANLP